MTDADRVYQLSKVELQNIEQIVASTPRDVLGALDSRNPAEMRRAIRFVERMDKDAGNVLADLRAHQARAHRAASRVARLMYICRMHNIFVTEDDLESDEPVPRDSMRYERWPPASVGVRMRRRGGRKGWVIGDDGRWQRAEKDAPVAPRIGQEGEEA